MAHRYNEGLIKGVCEALNVGSLREIAIERKYRGSGERYVCFDHIDEFRKVQRLVQRVKEWIIHYKYVR